MGNTKKVSRLTRIYSLPSLITIAFTIVFKSNIPTCTTGAVDHEQNKITTNNSKRKAVKSIYFLWISSANLTLSAMVNGVNNTARS